VALAALLGVKGKALHKTKLPSFSSREVLCRTLLGAGEGFSVQL